MTIDRAGRARLTIVGDRFGFVRAGVVIVVNRTFGIAMTLSANVSMMTNDEANKMTKARSEVK